MRYWRAMICVLAFSIANTASAGLPVERQMTCPIGGELFTVVSTTSCSRLGRLMTMRPITSCEFTTQLPVCPSNGLPLYKRFNAQERRFLEAHLLTPAWEAARDLPAWQRAYTLVEEFEDRGTENSFVVLLNAYWNETESFLARPELIEAFGLEMSANIRRAPDQAGMSFAIWAYMLGLAGQTDDAEIRLSQAREAASDEAFVQSYIEQVERCLADMSAENCDAHSQFEFEPE